MNAEMTLSGLGLEEMDDAAMMSVSGGDLIPSFLMDPCIKVVTALVICIVTSADSIVDGVAAGWNAA